MEPTSKILNNANLHPNKSNTMFDILSAQYKKFLSQMEKSDMKNGYTRYLAENTILESLLKEAKLSSSSNAAQIEARLKEVKDILKTQKGIIIK